MIYNQKNAFNDIRVTRLVPSQQLTTKKDQKLNEDTTALFIGNDP